MRGVILVAVLLSSAGCLGFGDEDPSAVSDGPPEEPAPPIQQPNITVEEPDVPGWPHFPNDGFSEKIRLEVPSFDGYLIPVTVYKPLIASNETQFPILLESHGFTGTKKTADDAFLPYIAAGFGVVSFDQRGHGDARSTSVVGFMQPDIEVLDAMMLISEIATWDWVLMEAEADPLLGGIGYSYAGAFQLMTSVFDPRIDVIAPEITWHNITTALAPNGAIKSGWVDLFYAAGNAQQSVTFNDDFHAGFAWATGTNELPEGQAPMIPDLVTEFNEASPQSYPGTIQAPALFVQGMTDSLFPLNQAVWNYQELMSRGVDAYLYTHLEGHIINTESLAPGNSPVAAGLQGAPGGRPCGDQDDLNIAWHQKHLLGLDVDLGPRVCISLEDQTAIVGDSFPLPSTEMIVAEAPGPYPIAQAVGGTAVPIEVMVAEGETVLAGIPILKGSITAPGPDTIVYWSLAMVREGVMEHIVDDQVRPLRITGPNTAAIEFEMELGGIGTRLQDGDSLYLMLTSVEPMFFGNSERIPSGTVLQDLELQLPVVTAPVFA